MKVGDCVKRNGPHIYSGKDWGDRESHDGELGVVLQAELSHAPEAARVQWASGRTSYIDRACLKKANNGLLPEPKPKIIKMG